MCCLTLQEIGGFCKAPVMVPDNLEGILFNEYFWKYNEDLAFVMRLLKHVFFPPHHKIYTKNGNE